MRIHNQTLLFSARLSVAIVTLAIGSCGILGTKHPQMHGRVLHEIHDKPIPDTIVVALWRGTEGSGNNEKTVCYHVESTQTDDKGFFTIPEWREPGSYESLKNSYVLGIQPESIEKGNGISMPVRRAIKNVLAQVIEIGINGTDGA